MNFEMKRVVMLGDNIDLYNVVQWEAAQGSYFYAMKNLKIWCLMKNWSEMKKAMKHFKMAHENFRISYLYFDMQFNDWEEFKFDLDFYGHIFNDLIESIVRVYGKRFAPELNMEGLPWLNSIVRKDSPNSSVV